mmetsp:Transcript_34351/g.62698  ORF Transcript_34351/g.62698 Transcript_34351/m.62698 type:complete len:312 (+) Transcript_34351:251-1186(+)
MPMRTGSGPRSVSGMAVSGVCVIGWRGGLDELEQLAERTAAALLGHVGGVLAGGAHEVAQLLDVDVGMIGQELLQRIITGQQALAPALGLVQAQAVLRMAELEGRHGLAHRLGVDLAHQLADVLHLPAAALEVGDLLGRLEGVVQDFRQGQRLPAAFRQFEQLLAELLQRGHVALHLGLAGAVEVVVVFEFGGVFLHLLPCSDESYDCRPLEFSVLHVPSPRRFRLQPRTVPAVDRRHACRGETTGRQRCRCRGVGRLRAVGLRAAGQARERRAQSRQVARRVHLPRPAPRQCQHVRLFAPGHPRHGACCL